MMSSVNTLPHSLYFVVAYVRPLTVCKDLFMSMWVTDCCAPAAPDGMTYAVVGTFIGYSNVIHSADHTWESWQRQMVVLLLNNCKAHSKKTWLSVSVSWIWISRPARRLHRGGDSRRSPLQQSQQCVGRLRRHGSLKANYHWDNI